MRRGRARPGRPRRRRRPGPRAALFPAGVTSALTRAKLASCVEPAFRNLADPARIVGSVSDLKLDFGGWNRAGEGDHLASRREVRDRTEESGFTASGRWAPPTTRPSTGGRRRATAGGRPGNAVHRDRGARQHQLRVTRADRIAVGAELRAQPFQGRLRRRRRGRRGRGRRRGAAAPRRDRAAGRRGAARAGGGARAGPPLPSVRWGPEPALAE